MRLPDTHSAGQAGATGQFGRVIHMRKSDRESLKSVLFLPGVRHMDIINDYPYKVIKKV